MSQRYTNYTNVDADSWAFDVGQPFSVCGWLYYVAAGGGGGGDLFYSEEWTVSSLRLGFDYNAGPALVWATNSVNHAEAVSLGQWYHMALTGDGTTVRYYLDGVEVGNVAATLSGTHTLSDLGDFGNGLSVVELAQIKVWQGHCLSPSELATEIAYWTPQTATSDVYAWWQLDASDPTLDSSGNSHTLSGPGTANGTFTPPGQLNPPPAVQPVAASGGATSSGAAVVRLRMRVQATGNAVASGTAWVSTNVAPAGGSASSFGGRSRKRRNRR